MTFRLSVLRIVFSLLDHKCDEYLRLHRSTSSDQPVQVFFAHHFVLQLKVLVFRTTPTASCSLLSLTASPCIALHQFLIVPGLATSSRQRSYCRRGGFHDGYEQTPEFVASHYPSIINRELLINLLLI